jgi:hypothetical protein
MNTTIAQDTERNAQQEGMNIKVPPFLQLFGPADNKRFKYYVYIKQYLQGPERTSGAAFARAHELDPTAFNNFVKAFHQDRMKPETFGDPVNHFPPTFRDHQLENAMRDIKNYYAYLGLHQNNSSAREGAINNKINISQQENLSHRLRMKFSFTAKYCNTFRLIWRAMFFTTAKIKSTNEELFKLFIFSNQLAVPAAPSEILNHHRTHNPRPEDISMQDDLPLISDDKVILTHRRNVKRRINDEV